MDFNNIPLEMRQYQSWICWRYEDIESPKPTKVPYNPKTGRLASVTDPDTWASYAEAVTAASKPNWYSGIGFVLSENDPFAFIDLDDTKGDASALDKQLQIYEQFDTYAERSPSGRGLHLIVKGSVTSGRRRGSIEVYSNQRYMTMTGNVYRNTDIKESNGELTALWNMLGHGGVATVFYAGLEQEKEPDNVILNRAAAAVNGDKFVALYTGRWQDFYPSQSEADFALIDIIAFYTQCKKQIVRLFHNSELGKRDKAKRIDYIHYMLNKCFDRMLPPVDTDGLLNQINEAMQAKKLPAVVVRDMIASEYLPPTFDVPPGLIGEIAQFIYQQAPRPVPEIALTAALGLISGIVGRAYNVSATGLNQYILLLAATGTGKEAMASGINKLMGAVLKTVPASIDFMGPGSIASAPALIKYMNKTSNSFVSVVGEFGLYMQQMASQNAPPHLTALRGLLLDLYTKSGEGEVLRPSIYSDKDKNTASILSPAFTLLGESTPEKFYEGLHEGLIVEGLLPRFTVIEYRGQRPPLNSQHMFVQPSFELIEKLANLCAYALTLNSQNKAIQVQYEAQAEAIFKKFDKHCDLNINGSDKEVKKHLWNRAHLKAIKLSSLIAIGCNPYKPAITPAMAQWAIDLVVADVRNMLGRFDAGEIGINNDESKQLNEVIRLVKDYLTQPWSEVEKYRVGNMRLHANRVIPYSYIHKRITSLAIFKKDRMGETNAVRRTMNTLIERGDIQELSRGKLAAEYDVSSRCFMVSQPRTFGF